MTPRIKFCGAAGTVTGSCTWIKAHGYSFLVDCGMFQGSKTLKALNYDAFPFRPDEIDFVLLTHAHIDHSGLIPKLIKEGFSGKVYATEGTRDLAAFMWPDSGYIQESEVRHLNRRNEQKGEKSVVPIYGAADGEDAVNSVETVSYCKWIDLPAGIRARYWNAGHILGSASIEIELPPDNSGENPIRLLFSGDIGPDQKMFHPDPDGPADIDYLFCESTYGNRARPELNQGQRREQLAQEIQKALKNGNGTIVIPAFSVERTQELLVDLGILMKEKRIKETLVFLDSPLAIRATETFARHAENLEDLHSAGDLVSNENFIFTRTADESKKINSFANNLIIIAASGMCEAGRIRHHLKRRLWQRETTVFMVGFQATGTLGALLLEGKSHVKIQGEPVIVRATIRNLDIYSGHADADGLVQWIGERQPINHRIFLIHGETAGLGGLRDRLIKRGVASNRITIPELDEEFILDRRQPMSRAQREVRRIAPEAVARLDWHNELAQLSLDIVDELEKAADEKSRQKILRRLRRALDNGSQSD